MWGSAPRRDSHHPPSPGGSPAEVGGDSPRKLQLHPGQGWGCSGSSWARIWPQHPIPGVRYSPPRPGKILSGTAGLPLPLRRCQRGHGRGAAARRGLGGGGGHRLRHPSGAQGGKGCPRGVEPRQREGAPSCRPGVGCCTRLQCPQRCCAKSKGAQPQNGPRVTQPWQRCPFGVASLGTTGCRGEMLWGAGFGPTCARGGVSPH